ncbi:MAG: arylamine N-acetyltransferase [Anaerofustis sp.]
MIDGSYKNIYGFTLEPSSRADYELSNYFTSTHPDSIFTKVPMLMIPTRSGRITVFDRQMKLTDREDVTEISIESEDQMNRILKEYFGIE